MKKVSFCILMAIFAVAVISCDKNNEEEENIVNSGKLEIGGETLPLDSATFAYFEVSGTITLRLLNGNNAINITLANIWNGEMPTGTLVINRDEHSKATLYGVGFYYGKYDGIANADDKITISKKENRYNITVTGTFKQYPYTATYSGTIRKAN